MISSHQLPQYEISYHTAQGLVKTTCSTKEAFDLFVNQIKSEYGEKAIVEMKGPQIFESQLLLG